MDPYQAKLFTSQLLRLITRALFERRWESFLVEYLNEDARWVGGVTRVPSLVKEKQICGDQGTLICSPYSFITFDSDFKI
jgi:hypothetical protein